MDFSGRIAESCGCGRLSAFAKRSDASLSAADHWLRHRVRSRLGLGQRPDSLLQRQLIEHNQHHLLVTAATFLDYLGLRDLADLPALPSGK